jgi:glutamate synthase (NADPH/NADH) small chain
MKRNAGMKQEPSARTANFDEVSRGLSAEQAIEEASRCLKCKNPLCVKGCPVEVDIPKFIALIRDNRVDEALASIKEKNSLPAVCGRVCPQENQCEKHCILAKKGVPIAIGLLERYAADCGAGNKDVGDAVKAQAGRKNGTRVAVIGSGPAGLTAAADLALMGYDVTIFESLHEAGGVLRYGIPEFRLPKGIVDKEIEYIQSLGVKLEVNVAVGQTITLEELWLEGFKAVFIGTGAGLPHFLGIPGENLGGVYSANEFLTRVNLMKAYKFPEFDTPVKIGNRVCVFGAGNVAMDAARTAARLGAETVTIVYRRSMDEVPARAEEVENALEEGIVFQCLSNPVRITGGDRGEVTGVECLKMELGEPDESGRRSPHPIPGSEYTIPADTVIVAVGQGPNPILIRSAKDLKLNRKGYIEVDSSTGATNIEGVFAGGDIVTGAATVIAAMGSGKLAAQSIDRYLKGMPVS